MVATSASKLVYIQSALLHVSANHVAIFREVKYEVRHIESINYSVLVYFFDVSNFVFYFPENGHLFGQNL
jgi:hypothetical protein